MGSLKIEGVRKSFGKVDVLKGIDLTVEDGEFVVFVGPSGCGKSTLLRVIAGLEDATSGRVLIDEADVTVVPPANRGIAMVFQTYALYPHLSVKNNMSLGLKQIGTPAAEIERRVAAASSMLSLEPYLERRPAELSGGQRQRVAIGRAVVREPKLFLFDEPLSNLDAELRVHMRIEIAKLHKTLATTVIYVTHDQVEAMTLADKIVVLRAGVVEQVGSPLDLYDDPENLFVAGFIGSPKMNFIGGDKAKAFNADTVGVRGEHITIVPDNGTWTGTVIHTENLGADSYVYLEMGTEEPVVVRLDGANDYKSGDVVHIAPMEDKIHRFDGAGKPIR